MLPSIAVVGATGAVGEIMRLVLAEHNFSFRSIKFLASERSAGKTIDFNGQTYVVEAIRPEAFVDVDIVLFSRADELTLEIRDDGKGLSRDGSARGDTVGRSGAFGIIGMRERILSLGGWMDVTGAPGKGTTVMVGIPMGPPERAA